MGEQDFYTGRLAQAGLEVVIPNDADRAVCNEVIYSELCKDIITEESRRAYEQIASRLREHGADSLILGCTEVGMLLDEANAGLPTFDTAKIHCESAVEKAFGDDVLL